MTEYQRRIRLAREYGRICYERGMARREGFVKFPSAIDYRLAWFKGFDRAHDRRQKEDAA